MAHKDLVKEVLDELLLERARCEEPVEVSPQQFCHEVAVFIISIIDAHGAGGVKVHVFQWRYEDIA